MKERYLCGVPSCRDSFLLVDEDMNQYYFIFAVKLLFCVKVVKPREKKKMYIWYNRVIMENMIP